MTSFPDATRTGNGQRKTGSPWPGPPGAGRTPVGRAVWRAPAALIPEPPEHAVERPRLVELLATGTGYELTLVSAPAGTGKTVAVSSWARAAAPLAPVVWISVSPGDADEDAFAGIVRTELERAGVPLAGESAYAPTARPTRSPATTLVLDDADRLSLASLRGLDELVTRLQRRLRLILVVRSDVAVPVQRYRLRHEVLEVRTAELAFTEEEAGALIADRVPDLPPGKLNLLLERSHGWATGLTFAAQAMEGSTDPVRVIDRLRADSGVIADYLVGEVFSGHSARDRSVLLRTSVADVVPQPLARLLAGARAVPTLKHLLRDNTFVERDPDDPHAYRYHPLFREMLAARLKHEAPRESARLHRVAAQWFAEQGMVVEAVRCAVRGKDWAGAATYALQRPDVSELLAPNGTVLSRLLGEAPPNVPGAAPTLVRAAIAARRGLAVECLRHLSDAHTAMERETPTAGEIVSTNAISAAHAALVGDAAGALKATSAAHRLLADATTPLSDAVGELNLVLDTIEGDALLWRGHLSAAADAYAVTVALGIRPGYENIHIAALGKVALIAAWRGERRRAVGIARKSINLAVRLDLRDVAECAAAEAALAWALLQETEESRASRHVEPRQTSTDRPFDAVVRATLAFVTARDRASAGDLSGARATLVEFREQEPRMSRWLQECVAAEELLLDEPDATSNAVGNNLLSNDTQPYVDRWLRDAQQHLLRGHEEEAVLSVEAALDLAAPQRLARPFHEVPDAVRELLLTHPRIGARHPRLGAELAPPRSEVAESATPPAQAAAPGAGPVESLTPKEREVLGYLADLLTTAEIAATMYISVNTVRTHVRNILRKLAVERRHKAVRRARELGILRR